MDLIINWLSKQKDILTVVDLGCGDAKIAQTMKKHKVHSFDLVAANEFVQVADSANV